MYMSSKCNEVQGLRIIYSSIYLFTNVLLQNSTSLVFTVSKLALGMFPLRYKMHGLKSSDVWVGTRTFYQV